MALSALRMEHITKVYPNGVVANKDILFDVEVGEIHALSGENGAGKTTLMKILFGEEKATSGIISIGGKPVVIQSPNDALKLGIGMVHQHFMLVPSLTVMENMILGMEPTKGLFIDKESAIKKVTELGRKYNMYLDPNETVKNLSVGQKQKLEILKVLIRGATILILDEPTAVLTPQETKELFEELKILKNDGFTIIFISHKLQEVRELCSKITIIRKGESKGMYTLSDISDNEISRLMVGHGVSLDIMKPPLKRGNIALNVHHLTIKEDQKRDVVTDLSFVIGEGEIVGIAGVEGNGQSELVEAITGLGPYHEGIIEFEGNKIIPYRVGYVRNLGISHIPEDRMSIGIAPNLTITENMIADKIDDSSFQQSPFLLSKKKMNEYGKKLVKEYNILCKTPDVAIMSLSGGNIQKAVLARELARDPKLIVANQPTRGVDVGATEFIRTQLVSLRGKGKSVLLVSSDLTELLSLSDRLFVMFEGRIVAVFRNVNSVNEEILGRYMLGLEKQEQAEIERGAYEI